ncbi:TolC family protein [Zunongwangia endophytica]|uniref:TolC family protein n=1 Tax=Zunongwangia endophytica TaxID=1808945 RepID=A0ABV8H6Z2_9FLAO|nr:TolC family protein [Zunongwangia endophytica]MDN3594803.1 TolC family protein [Zunongwangia endophytica]
MRKFICLFYFSIFGVFFGNAQEKGSEIFTLQEFLAMVKRYHPIVAQANLDLSAAEAKLLKSRGAFDPKLEGGVKEKNFKGTEYYSLWNGTFKIPTWYGIDLKAGYEQNEGYYLNPEHTTPDDGLWSAGVNVRLAQGLLYNERMNSLKQAKIFRRQSEVERDIQINQVLADAAKAYADWVYYYQNTSVYGEFLDNAIIRFEGVATSSRLGETPAIDTVETMITVRSRRLDLKQAELKLQKAKLALSNYLWIEEIPIELEDRMRPTPEITDFSAVLGINNLLGNATEVDDHPKIQSLEFDIEAYDLDIRLRRNKLLPKIDVEYNFLSEEIDDPDYINVNNYKAGVKVSFPLFLRKERGDLRLAKVKREQAEFKIAESQWKLSNKIKATEREIISLEEQSIIVSNIVNESQIMVEAEKRLFEMGESSIFYINTRENKLIDAILKRNKIINELNLATAKLFETLRIEYD